MRIDAVLFDVFGTLCDIRRKRHPFLALAKRTSSPRSVIEMAMTRDISGEDIGRRFDVSSGEVRRFTAELHDELASIDLFADADTVLGTLSASGVKIGLVSNLAKQYAEPALDQLPLRPDVCIWSFECGWLKPDARIFALACNSLDMKPENVLMVGDSLLADYRGARSFGMQAVLLDRHSVGPEDCISVQSLGSILSIVNDSKK
ncbi:HAD family hydrolase [Pandoraea communis]|uniref:HAD family hydrolase n=1 Tax=Pandoraea communis TaxID=2508297 RepID=UPI0025A55D48|nr:HAD family hydrolase [Pandoraea communis]MDM8359052.1 HAD family hydrolase [Pandoraea communis]